VLLCTATYTLTQPVRSGSGRGSLVGYSAAGPPLYNFAGDALQRTSQSVMVLARSGLRQILDESDSRRIFYFLCVNLVSVVSPRHSAVASVSSVIALKRKGKEEYLYSAFLHQG